LKRRIHLQEVKLTNGTIHYGEILSKNDKAVWLKLKNGQKIRLSKNGILQIKDLGWQTTQNELNNNGG